MRVDDRYLNNSQAVQTGKAAGPQEIDRQGDPRQTESRWGPGADRVELSALSGGLARVLSTAARERAERVEQLRQEYADGRYQVNIVALSRAIAAEARGSAGRERPASADHSKA